MPDVAAIIQWGALPETASLVDEPNILIQSLTITPSRDEKYYKGAATRADEGVSLTNPSLTFAFKAYVSAESGLAVQHPGTQVTELANFAAVIHGFDPAQGMMLYKDPSRELTIEDPDMVNFTVVHKPFIEPS